MRVWDNTSDKVKSSEKTININNQPIVSTHHSVEAHIVININAVLITIS